MKAARVESASEGREGTRAKQAITTASVMASGALAALKRH